MGEGKDKPSKKWSPFTVTWEREKRNKREKESESERKRVLPSLKIYTYLEKGKDHHFEHIL